MMEQCFSLPLSKNAPTPERMLKEDFVTILYDRKGYPRRFRKSDTLGILRKKEWIDDNALTVADRWLSDWIFARHGYCDALKESGGEYVKGDAITFGITRAKASKRINDFYHRAGLDAHNMLVLLLGFNWSFRALGEYFFPQLQQRRAVERAQSFAAETLYELYQFHLERRKKHRERQKEEVKSDFDHISA